MNKELPKEFDVFIENEKYEILTEYGYQAFDGLLKNMKVSNILEFHMEDGEVIRSTEDHKWFFNKELYKLSKEYKVGDKIYSPKKSKKIVDIKNGDIADVYDLLDVKNGNTFLVGKSWLKSRQCLYVDEFAHIDNDVEFYTSTYPTITSGKTTKVILTSTPNGMNLFYKIWKESTTGYNKFKNYHVHYSEHPSRDEAWVEETLTAISPQKFDVEYNCSFLGSSDTLIAGLKLQQLSFVQAIRETETGDVKVYAEPDRFKKYVTVVDPAEGVGGDYSVISVFDVSQVPFKQVFLFRHNEMTPSEFSMIVYQVATQYKDSTLVIESNNAAGAIVVNDLWEMEYENILYSSVDDSENSADGEGGGGSKSKPGIRTTKKTKKIGCSRLKDLIERDKLLIQDAETLMELSTFVRVNASYQAEKGKHDDIAMTLVIFAWFTGEDYFEDMVGISTKSHIKTAHQDGTGYQDVLGFIANGVSNLDEYDNSWLFNK